MPSQVTTFVYALASSLALLLVGEAYLAEWVAGGFVLGFNYGVSSRVNTTLFATPQARAQALGAIGRLCGIGERTRRAPLLALRAA